MAATREADDATLLAGVQRLADELHRAGVTTFECKSGYGLTVEDEARSLRIAGAVTDETTFLGAHVVPAEFRDDRAAYIDLVTGPMLQACAPHARWVDVFCDRGAFDVDEPATSSAAGWPRTHPGLHAGQLGPSAGIRLAVELGAASVDHCTYATDDDVEALAGAADTTVATLLPGAEFSTRARYPDAKRLIDAGATVALATDCNPGSSFTTSMPFCIAVAVRDMNFTPAQALWAATAGGAAALRRTDVGVLAVGRRADFVRLDAPSYLHLAYRPGVPLVRDVVKAGQQTAVPRTTSRGGVTTVNTEAVVVGIGPVTFDEVVRVARDGAAVTLSDESLDAIAKSRARIEQLANDPKPVYGVSTGFGALATRHIPRELRTQLQRSLIRSHAAGSGPEIEREVVRAMMLLRLSTLATGRTGVRPVVAQTYAELLSAGLTPVVYEYGSLGCSGDLAPWLTWRWRSSARVRCARPTVNCRRPPMRWPARHRTGRARREGGPGPDQRHRRHARHAGAGAARPGPLLKLADVAASMSVEGLLGSDRVFAADLQALRPHPGQADAAANMSRVLAESPIVASHSGPDCSLVQDAYSLRCAPQVAGAARDTVEHARTVAGRELASAVDNPVVTLDGRVESNGNFHGAPVAYVLDFLAIAVADVASISERRTDRFLDVARNRGLNAFLADDPGVDSGHMIAQYTQAAIVSELKRLANPASVDRSRPQRCRKTTCPWGGRRRASFAGRSTD